MNPRITISEMQHGIFKGAQSFNPRFVTDRPLLFSTLEIRWDPRRPRQAVADLEEKLLAFSPGLQRHQCRGMEAYHVFALRPNGPTPGEPGGASRSAGPAQPYEASLALAHLLEHAVIDFQCEVTGETSCSGVTAAHRDQAHRFDLMVECSTPQTGRCCLALALSWLQAAIGGHFLGAAEREVLAALRWMHRSTAPSVCSTLLAGALGWSENRAAVALEALRQAGYLWVVPYAVNFSGLAEYRPRPWEEAPLPRAEAGGRVASGVS